MALLELSPKTLNTPYSNYPFNVIEFTQGEDYKFTLKFSNPDKTSFSLTGYIINMSIIERWNESTLYSIVHEVDSSDSSILHCVIPKLTTAALTHDSYHCFIGLVNALGEVFIPESCKLLLWSKKGILPSS